MELIKEIYETVAFNETNIRVVGTYTEPWFVAKDICLILDIKDVSMALNKIDDKHKSSKLINTLGGKQDMRVVNESGLYRLIARSNKPIAQKFQDAVFDEILPSLRIKGHYTIQSIVDKNKELEEEKLKFEKENLILEHKLELEKEKQSLKEKNRDLLSNTIELYSLSRTHDKILRKRKRTAYDIGNVVYIISNEAFNSYYGNLYYKIGKATQGSNENSSAFTNRLSAYNTGTPKSYTVHYVCYVEQNDIIEKMIKLKFRKNLDESNKEEWIFNTSLETIIKFIRQQCCSFELSFEEKIIGDIANIEEIKEETTDEEENNDEESKEDIIKKECLSKRLYNNFNQIKKVVLRNIIYIISNDKCGNQYKIDRATLYENEDIADFALKLYKKDYNIHYICFVEQNDLLMKMIKLNFKDDWISNLCVSKLISHIRNLCETTNLTFEEKIFEKEKVETEIKENEEVIEIDDGQVRISDVEKCSTDLSKLQGFCRKLGISQKGVCTDLYDRIIHFIKTGEENPYRTLEELRKICKEYDLIHTGNKNVLEERIKYYLETGNKVRYVNIEDVVENVVENVVSQDISLEKEYIINNIDKFTSEKIVSICNLYKLGSKTSNDVLKQRIRNFLIKGLKETERRKDVYQYDKNGKFIKHYNSIVEAKSETNICGNVIANALNKNCMVNNFIFRNMHIDFYELDLKEINNHSTTFKKQLTKNDHVKIQKLFNNGQTKKSLIALYSISKTQINRILKKELDEE